MTASYLIVVEERHVFAGLFLVYGQYLILCHFDLLTNIRNRDRPSEDRPHWTYQVPATRTRSPDAEPSHQRRLLRLVTSKPTHPLLPSCTSLAPSGAMGNCSMRWTRTCFGRFWDSYFVITDLCSLRGSTTWTTHSPLPSCT